MKIDIRMFIALRNNENKSSELTLLQSNMALRKIKKASVMLNHHFLLSAGYAPSNKKGGKRIIDVPLGIETVNQYKKALIITYDYQFEHQAILWTSPKKTIELLDLIKKYDHGFVYDQV